MAKIGGIQLMPVHGTAEVHHSGYKVDFKRPDGTLFARMWPGRDTIRATIYSSSGKPTGSLEESRGLINPSTLQLVNEAEAKSNAVVQQAENDALKRSL